MSRRRRGDLLGWLLLGVVALGLAALGVFALLRPQPNESLDPQTLCPRGRAPSAHTIVLVDATDPLEPRHRKRLQAAIRSEQARLAPGDRLSVLTLDAERPREPRVIFSLCDPGDGREANPLVSSTRDAQARFEEAFGEPLETAIRRAEKGRRGRETPLVEALLSIGADPDFSPSVPARRLVIVSDLLEHREGRFSLYADGADLAGWKAEYGPENIPRLEGVAVRMIPIDRPDLSARQAAARDGFWAPLLAEAGANVTVDP